jgi:hypothetical protein
MPFQEIFLAYSRGGKNQFEGSTLIKTDANGFFNINIKSQRAGQTGVKFYYGLYITKNDSGSYEGSIPVGTNNEVILQ